uniref:Acyltransferase 3 domain-containing protein n=1 Tax=Acrobeloides nanus TaxID=290746 RepID=A0A914BZ62_9BILA
MNVFKECHISLKKTENLFKDTKKPLEENENSRQKEASKHNAVKNGLRKEIDYFLNDQSVSIFKQRLFLESFAQGDALHFNGRDQDRWLFNFYKCQRSANETSTTPSSYPLSFCYGLDDLNAIGICIPTTCEKDTNNFFEEIQNFLPIHKNLSMPKHIQCIASRWQKQWYEQPIPIAGLSFTMLLVVIVGIATLVDGKSSNKKKLNSTTMKILLSFSLKLNLSKISTAPKNITSTITCIWGLKFFAMLWAIAGHSFIVVQYFIQNVEKFKDELVDNFWYQWMSNSTVCVDIFFTLSGTLVAFIWFNKWMRNTKEKEPTWTSIGYWLTFYRHRIIRLWPAYIYTLFIITYHYSVSHYQPSWPHTDPSIQCNQYWWRNLLFINSFTKNLCLPWTWYIGTEFIFYLVSPIFLLTLRKNQNYGIFLATFTIIISCLLNVITMYEYNFPPTQMLWKQPEIFNQDYMQHHEVMYIKPQYRISPYIEDFGQYMDCTQHYRDGIGLYTISSLELFKEPFFPYHYLG